MASRSRRDWIVDSALFLLALVVGAALYSNEVRINDPPQGLLVAGIVAGFIACGALWLRRRRPVGVAVLNLFLFAVASFPAVAALIAFFTVAANRPAKTVARLALAGLLLATPISAVIHADDGDALSTLVWLLLFAATGAWGMYVRARRLLLLSLRERAERAEAEQQEHVERAREQERAQVAREMHDVLAHRISLLSMHAGSLEFHPDAAPDEIAKAAGVIRASAHQALEDLREVIGVLRQGDEAPARPQPTLSDLSELVEESREAGMTVHSALALEGSEAAPLAVGRNAYRIVQEGLTNARKHARGATVELAVSGEAGAGLTIEVRNPLPVGRAASRIPGAGTGLIGLAERADLSGGRLEHGHTPGGEYRLWAWLPWPA
jgi:signal transduction histidine kinase